MRLKALVMLVLLLLSGCARGMYRWEGYDRHLRDYLLEPDKLTAYATALDRVMAKAEKSGTRMPPGIYAEYGRVLYLRQEYSRAIVYFDCEKTVYPESTRLMNQWIADAGKLSEARP